MNQRFFRVASRPSDAHDLDQYQIRQWVSGRRYLPNEYVIIDEMPYLCMLTHQATYATRPGMDRENHWLLCSLPNAMYLVADGTQLVTDSHGKITELGSGGGGPSGPSLYAQEFLASPNGSDQELATASLRWSGVRATSRGSHTSSLWVNSDESYSYFSCSVQDQPDAPLALGFAGLPTSDPGWEGGVWQEGGVVRVSGAPIDEGTLRLGEMLAVTADGTWSVRTSWSGVEIHSNASTNATFSIDSAQADSYLQAWVDNNPTAPLMVVMAGLPTTAPSGSPGQLWNDNGTLKVA